MLARTTNLIFNREPAGPPPANQDPHVVPRAKKIKPTTGKTATRRVPGPKPSSANADNISEAIRVLAAEDEMDAEMAVAARELVDEPDSTVQSQELTQPRASPPTSPILPGPAGAGGEDDEQRFDDDQFKLMMIALPQLAASAARRCRPR